MSDPFTLRLYVPSGNPEEMRRVEKTGWSGVGFVVPRSSLRMFTKEDAAGRPGVYVLSGPSPEGGQDIIYIGEADRLGRRLIQQQTKDFWTTAYVFTAKDGHLNKAHVQYLEKNLLRLAQEARRYRLDNQDSGNDISLYDLDEADANAFLKEVLLCCPLIGLKAFEKPKTQGTLPEDTVHSPGGFSLTNGVRAQRSGGILVSQTSSTQLQELYFLSGQESQGRGYESPNGFTVLEGARGRKEPVPSATEAMRRTRAELLEQGVFIEGRDAIHLMQHYEFPSPTAAAIALLGRTANGPSEWKDATGTTLKERRETVDEYPKEERSSQDDLDGRALTDGTTDQSGGTKGIGKGLPDRASGNLGDQRIFYSLCFPENSPGLKAVGFCSAGHFGKGFTVLKGAKGKREFAPSTPDHHRRARDELLRQNILYDTGSVMELRQDHEFSSPSQAASVLLGRSASGPQKWKDSQGNALGEKRNQKA